MQHKKDMLVENLFNDLDFKQIFYVLLNYRYQLIGITILASMLGLIYTYCLPPKYISTALIQIDSQLGSSNSMQQMLGSLTTSYQATQASPADIEIALIKSRYILHSVIDKLNLNVHITPRYFPLLGVNMAQHFHGKGLAEPWFDLKQFAWGGEKLEIATFSSYDDLSDVHFNLEVLDANTYALYLNDGTFLLKGKLNQLVTIDSPMPLTINVAQMQARPSTSFYINVERTSDMLMTLTQGLTIEDLGSKDKTKTGVLQLSLEGNNSRLLPVILNNIVQFAIQRNIEKKSAEASKTLEFLNLQLPTVRENLDLAETRLNAYRAKSGTIDISQEAKIILMQLSAIEQSIADVKLKKVEMLQELTERHPFVISLKYKERQLEKEAHSLTQKIKQLPKTDQQAVSLERDVKVKNQLYLLLLNKIQQLEVLKAGTLSDIRVLSSATLPYMPIPQHKSFFVVSATLLGFFIGLFSVFIRTYFRKGVNDPELVEARLGVPTFAVIPHSPQQKKNTKDFVLAKSAQQDIAIEGIRSLRTMLEFSIPAPRNNIISILGASPNIGKSFISTNLAQVLADSGKRILLIDCDLRKGKLHQYLGQKKTPGFAEVLMRQYLPNEVMVHISSNYDFIAAGQYPHNPSELLANSYFTEILQPLSAQYDFLVIDTPPVLAVTDGILVAKQAAINLAVVGAGTDEMKELEMMVKRVKNSGIQVDGLVFNNRVEAKHQYGQYHYYYAYATQE